MFETSKVMKELRVERVNHETGEVQLTETTTEAVVPKEPNYVKVYLRDLMYLRDLSPSLNVVMYELLNVMDYENTIFMNSGLKRIIEKRCGLAISSINNAITAFVKGKLLQRKDVGVYQVNPYLFGKGEWKNINQLRMEVTYTLGGKTFRTIVKEYNEYNTELPGFEEVQSDSESR